MVVGNDILTPNVPNNINWLYYETVEINNGMITFFGRHAYPLHNDVRVNKELHIWVSIHIPEMFIRTHWVYLG